VVLTLAAAPWLALSSRAWAQNCASPPNAIVAENCLPGNPSSQWDVGIGGGDPSIVGFATDISVNQGGAINFKINTSAKAYMMDIYRMGYDLTNRAFKVSHNRPRTRPQTQIAA